MNDFDLMKKEICLIWFAILFFSVLNAQETKSFTAQLKEANILIYQNPEKAIAISQEVYDKASDLETRITALAILVNGYGAKGEMGKALKLASEGVNLTADTNNIELKVSTLGSLGEQYQLIHLNKVARKYLDEAAALLEKASFPEEIRANIKGNLFAVKGNTYKDDIDCEYAIENYDLAIQSYMNFPDNPSVRNNLTLVYLEKGDCLMELSETEEAKKFYQQALELAKENKLQEYRIKGELGIAKIQAKEGEVYLSNQTALRLVKEVDTLLFLDIKNELFSLLADNFLELKNVGQYEHFHQLKNQVAEEIEKRENSAFEHALYFFN